LRDALLEDVHAHLESSLLFKGLEILVDDRDCEQNTSTRADRTEEIGDNRQSTDAHATKGGGNGDVSVEFLLNLDVAVALDDHLLLLELSRNVSGGRTRNFDPSLREEGASREHEGDIEDGVKRVGRYVGQRGRRGDVIHQTAGGNELAVTFAFLPATKELNEEVTTISLVQELRDEVEVGNQRRLQDDRHVGRVEELDGIVRHVATVLL